MKTEEINFEKMVTSLSLLLGMITAKLFQMQNQMTQDEVKFFQWWKDAMYDAMYNGKPVSLSTFPEKIYEPITFPSCRHGLVSNCAICDANTDNKL